MQTPAISCVVAVDSELGIGKDGAIPWRLKADMAHFKRVTTAVAEPTRQNAVVMGRVTWQSIPARFRPLPGRVNVVLSQELDLPDGVIGARSLDDALEKLRGRVERAFAIGGERVYADAMARPDCLEMYVTRVAGRHSCDRHLPPFERDFTLADVLGEGQEGGVGYRFEKWTRAVY